MSDAATYRSVLDEVGSTDANQFISVITMQNHMPYNDWYSDNEFTVTNTDGAEPLGEDETREIETYAKGVSLSDKATAEFLDELDAIDKPITVVFYGDHLPGIYSTAGRGPEQLVGPAPDRPTSSGPTRHRAARARRTRTATTPRRTTSSRRPPST